MDIRSISNLSPPATGGPEKAQAPTSAPASFVAPQAPAAPAQTAAAVPPPSPKPEGQQLEEIVKNINKTIQTLSPDLEFSIDHELNRPIVKVIDQKTKELIRQIPSEDVLDLAKALDRMQGLLVSQKV